MKKFIISLLIVICILGLNNNKVIPSKSIRLRVIANSNSTYDQDIKYKVKEEIENNMYLLVTKSNSIDDVRNNIKNNIDNLDYIVENTLKENNYNKDYSINYGMNYFPQKKYNGILYKEGEYESLLVTLGDGKGDNWWCVLFPPFCLIEAESSDDIEYDFKVREIIDKYF